jgi:hypothetical protein
MSARNLDKTDCEIADFIAENNPGGVTAFHPSAETKDRLAGLISREKITGLSPDEESELNLCMLVEHLMRLAKARARQHLSHEKRSFEV